MVTLNKTTLSDLRGAARLAIEATVGITELVERMHHTIQLRHPPFGESRAKVTTGVTGQVYRTVRGVTRLIGQGLDAGLAPISGMFPEGESSAARDAWISAINGVYGDYLERTSNPLAVEMSLRTGASRIDPESPADALPVATGKVLLIIHGLCLNELHWTRGGRNRVGSVSSDRGFTPVYLRYNTGRSIESNGRQLAGMLETLLGNWPCPVQDLSVVGHSMGGLVARSATREARLAGYDWPVRLRRLVFLGTPHQGAPLERGGYWLDRLMDLSPYAAPFARLGKARSAGITDLRHGSITHDKQESVPLPEGVKCYAVAAALGKRRSAAAERLIGDGLVPIGSALGQHRDAGRSLAIPRTHQYIGYELGHLELLGHPEVYQRVSAWLS